MKELPQEGKNNIVPINEVTTPVEDEQVRRYGTHIMQEIISRPEETWVKQARMYFLIVQDHINGTFATGPWLDSMIKLKAELARMGKVEAEDKT